MKIAMFTDTYFPQVSGVATSIKILVDELESHGHDVTIFTTTDPDAKLNEPKNIIRIASIPFLFFTDRRMVIGGMNKAYRIAKEKKFDIVHTHTEFGMGLIGKYVAYRLKIPIIHTYHTMYEKYLHYIANGHFVKPVHVKMLSSYFCNYTSGVISPGKKMTTILKSYNIDTEIRTIPTGVPVPFYSLENRLALREQLGIKENQFVLLSLSRLSKEKSIDQIIKVFPKVREKYDDAVLVIVGDGPIKKDLKKQVKSLELTDFVRFIGEIKHEDVYRYYQMADIYVNASETETQGLTYLEAIVNRLPVIAKKNEYLSAIITDKVYGSLFEQGELLAQTILDYVPVLKERQKLPSEKQEALLYEISSGRFSELVYRFYKDAIKMYEKNNRNKKNPKSYLFNKNYFSKWFNDDAENK